MNKKNGPDIIDKLLEACYDNNKDGLFIMSLMHQYEQRGFLTKGQMEGLYKVASKIPDINTGLLATLQATINKLPVRDKTPLNKETAKENFVKDAFVQKQIDEILQKYPQHKAILSFKNKLEKLVDLTATEKTELNKLHKLLIK